MFLESELLISVVTHLFESGIAALPLHDAVLVAEPNAEAAKAAMKHAFCAGSANSRAFVRIEFGSGK